MSQSEPVALRHVMEFTTKIVARRADAASTILGPSAGRTGLPAAPRRVVSRRGPHARGSHRRRESPSAPYPTRLRAGAAAAASGVDRGPRPRRCGARHRLQTPIRRVPQLLRPGAPGRVHSHDALPALRRAVRRRVVGLGLARVRSAHGPAGAGHAGAGPRPRAESARRGVRSGASDSGLATRAARSRPPVPRLAARLRSQPPRARSRRRHALPLLAAVPHQLGDALLEPAPLLLIAGPLHRREVALHLAIFVPTDLLPPNLILLPLAHQLLHAILVRRSRGKLGAKGLIDVTLARPDRLAPLFEAPLRRVQLAGLPGIPPPRRAPLPGPALLPSLPQLPRLPPVCRRGAAPNPPPMPPQRRRRRAPQDP